VKNIEQATHNHKRAGAVLVLESAAKLARVRVLTSGDEFWVKLADLTELADAFADQSTPSKKEPRAKRVNAAPDERFSALHPMEQLSAESKTNVTRG
jgi:hypothetical protein